MQQADTGTKMVHLGKNTKSRIVSKGISAGKAQNTYRGLVSMHPKAKESRNYTQCDSLLIGDKCGAHTVPYIEVKNNSSRVEHEATTSKVDDDQLFYCRQRGMDEEEAVALVVNGFCKDVSAGAADGVRHGSAATGGNLTGRLCRLMARTPRKNIQKDVVLTWLGYALPVLGGLLGMAYVNINLHGIHQPGLGGGHRWRNPWLDCRTSDPQSAGIGIYRGRRRPLRYAKGQNMLEIKNLHVQLEEEDKQILKGVNLTVEAGKVHAIMGPNGSGKSTLSYVLSGRDGYEVTEGSATSGR